MTELQRARALSRLSGLRDPAKRYGQRFSPERERELLAWAVTLPDETILDMRNTGPGTLRWIREHHPKAVPPNTTLGDVMKRTGWRIELFWNGSAGWFTARLVSLDDRAGRRGWDGGYLVPFDDPIGASGATPDEALASLDEAGARRA